MSLQPGQAVVCGGIEHLGSPCRRKQSLRRGMGRGEFEGRVREGEGGEGEGRGEGEEGGKFTIS